MSCTSATVFCGCRQCQQTLGTEKHFCFYTAADSGVQFAKKPEVDLSSTALKIGDAVGKKEGRAVLCSKCGFKVGNQLAVGPDGALLIGLGIEKVIINGQPFGKKQRWRELTHIFPALENRTSNTFHRNASGSTRPKTIGSDGVILPSSNNLSHFQIRDLVTSKKVPCGYQVEAFVEALLEDVLIVIPTGFGKTLVAAMVMKRFRELNPNRLAVMVVDRVPLVYQQADAVEHDTDMRVCRLCGESKTRLVVEQLLLGAYDAMVVTAGCLVELVNSDTLNLVRDASVVVFDEFHHATGKHAYVHLLRHLNNHSPFSATPKPRVVGLSASPFDGETIGAISASYTSITTEQFRNCRVFKPDLSAAQRQVEWVEVQQSPAEQRFETDIQDAICELFRQLSIATGTNWSVDQARLQRSRLKHQARVIRELHGHDSDSLEELSRLLFDLIAMHEASELLGIATAQQLLIDAWPDLRHGAESGGDGSRGLALPEPLRSRLVQLLTPISSAMSKLGAVSHRVSVLERELDGLGSDGRALVFVDTRRVAELVVSYLQRCYPDLNPTKVVGHGGADGMPWEGGQERSIELLRTGECRVLVATSVLEEGLDVPQCDLVIRFRGVRSSLIQLVQTRGRARKAGARFVCVVSPQDRFSVNALVAREALVDQFLVSVSRRSTGEHVLAGRPSTQARAILDRMGAPSASDGHGHVTSRAPDTWDGSAHMTATVLCMYLCGSDLPWNLEEELCSLLLSTAHAKLKHLEVVRGGAARHAGCPRVFDSDHSVALVDAVSANRNLSRLLYNTWDFLIGGCPVWCSVTAPTPQELSMERSGAAASFAFPLRQVWAGFLQDRQTFEGTELTAAKYSASQVLFVRKNNACAVEIASGFARITMQVTTIVSYALLSLHPDSFTLYLPYSSTPSLYVLDPFGSREIRQALLPATPAPFAFPQQLLVDDSEHAFQEDLQWLAQSRVLALVFPADQWDGVVGALHPDRCTRSKHVFDLGVPCYCTRVNVNVNVHVRSHSCDGAGTTASSAPETTPSPSRQALQTKRSNHNYDHDPLRSPLSQHLPNVPAAAALPIRLQSSARSTPTLSPAEQCVWSLGVLTTDPSLGLPPAAARSLWNLLGRSLTSGHASLASLCFAMASDSGSDSDSTRDPDLPPDPDSDPASDAALLPEDASSSADPSVCCSSMAGDVPGGEILSPPPPSVASLAAALQLLHVRLNALPPFVDASPLLESLLQSFSHLPPSCLPLVALTPPPNDALLRRVAITPTRVVLKPPVQVRSNRLLRMFPHHRFLIVSFGDEDGQPLRDPSLLPRVHHFLHNGVWVLGSTYRFLAASSSQMRQKSAYFVEGGADVVHRIRECIVTIVPMGSNSKDIGTGKSDSSTATTPIHKYMSMLALFLTADVPTLDLDLASECGKVADVVGSDGKLLTDGAGLIDAELARDVMRSLRRSESESELMPGSTLAGPDGRVVVPSALQIRLAGFKGVLVVEEGLCRRTGKKLLYRPSMRKFLSLHRTLCVVKTSTYGALHLSRELITCLCSLRDVTAAGVEWDPSHPIRRAHSDQLSALAGSLLDKGLAWRSLLSHLGRSVLRGVPPEFQEEFDPVADPFWQSVLRVLYLYSSRLLRSKAQVEVGNGCLLMGVPDPIGVLKPGQIFVQYQKDNVDVGAGAGVGVGVGVRPDSKQLGLAAPVVVTGSVMVFRHPCLNPADVRVVDAVDFPSLHHLRNVVVFSTHPSSPSIPASCSGGDLDGDQFGVVWDEHLVPPKELEEPPLDYDQILNDARTEAMSKPATTTPAPTTAEEYYLRVIQNEALGRVAHLHLALSDQLPLMAADPLAIELAKSQSVAVDYPKTGVPPTVPEKALEKVAQEGYPDFMEKPPDISYVSEKLLGRLYRTSRSLFEETLLTTTPTPSSSVSRSLQEPHIPNFSSGDGEVLNPALVTSGHTQFLTDALQVYDLYASSMTALMARFALRKESEAILGRAVHWHDSLSGDKGRAAGSLSAAWRDLRAKFRDEFFVDVATSSAELKQDKASAWYVAAYTRPVGVAESQSRRFYSFPWVVADVLSSILCRPPSAVPAASMATVVTSAQVARSSTRNSFLYVIGRTALEQYLSQAPHQQATLAVKHRTLASVKTALSSLGPSNPADAVLTRVFGSVALCWPELDSDIDLLVYRPDRYRSPSRTPCASAPVRPLNNLYGQCQPHLPHLFLPVGAGAGNDANDVLERVFTAVDGAFTSKRLIHADAGSIPVLRCTLDDGEDATRVDICSTPDGANKAALLHHLFQCHPHLHPFFSLVVQWARAVHLIRSAMLPGGLAVLASGQLQALVLHLLLRRSTSDPGPDPSWRVDLDVRSRHPALTTESHAATAFENRKETQGEASAPYLEFYQLLAGAEALLRDEAADGAVRLGECLVQFFTRGSSLVGPVRYVWPCPGRPTHTIEADAVSLFADRCRAALHMLGYHLHWTAFLAHAARAAEAESTAADGSQLSVRLPRAVSVRIRPAAEFHAARLSLLANTPVNISTTSSSHLVVTATGSYEQLHQVREEVARLSLLSRVVHVGAASQKVSAYFMRGASMLFVRNSLSRSAMATLVRLPVPCEARHRFLETSVVVLPNRAEVCDWQRAMRDELTHRIMQQLSSAASLDPPLLKSLSTTVRLGVFYVLNVKDALDSTTCSIAALETALATNRRQRKDAVRSDWDLDTVQRQRDEAQTKTALKPSGGGEDDRVRTSKTKKWKLACGYLSGIAAPTGQQYNLHTLVGLATATLESLHFVRVPDPSAAASALARCSRQIVEREAWLVNLTASSRFSVDVYLDASLQLLSISEKPLAWVHATLLHGLSPSPSPPPGAFLDRHDLRIRIDTSQTIRPSDDLYRFVFPNQTTIAPITIAKNGHPEAARHLPLDTRRRIAHVRHVLRRHFFLLDARSTLRSSCGHVCAHLSEVVHFSGEDLQLKSDPFLDLSLHFESAVVRGWVGAWHEPSKLMSWVHELLATSLAVSNSFNPVN